MELLEDGSAVATWMEFSDSRAQFRMRRVEPSGARSAAIAVTGVGEGRMSGYPRIARYGNELVFAWTESGSANEESNGALKVQTVVAPLPANCASSVTPPRPLAAVWLYGGDGAAGGVDCGFMNLPSSISTPC